MFPLHHCLQGLTLCNAGHDRGNLVCLNWTGFLGPCHIRLQSNAANLEAQAILLEDSRPQGILKLHRPSSLDYSASQGRPVLKHLI